MKPWLALETATDLGSVAVGAPGVGGLTAEIAFGGRRHAAALLPAAEEALRLAGASFADLEGIVVSDGPGSFTGLRIGLATAKGILRAVEGLALHTAPSLLAAAWGARPFAAGPVAALYDALRGEVFGAVYDAVDGGEGVRTLVAPRRARLASLVDECPVRPVLAVGDGAATYAAAVTRWCGRPPVGPPAGSPRAAALLELLGVAGGTSRVADPDAFAPEYGRPAEAQARWERAHGRPLPDSTGDAS